jgi:hypothetical protein
VFRPIEIPQKSDSINWPENEQEGAFGSRKLLLAPKPFCWEKSRLKPAATEKTANSPNAILREVENPVRSTSRGSFLSVRMTKNRFQRPVRAES